jgi:hypothetical protein
MHGDADSRRIAPSFLLRHEMTPRVPTEQHAGRASKQRHKNRSLSRSEIELYVANVDICSAAA